MNIEQLRTIQAPLKQAYRDNPGKACVTMSARGHCVAERLSCLVETPAGHVEAGLHPAAGGVGSLACSGDMLLQALVACSGVTLSAVALAMSIELTAANVVAEADMDFRGTLGIDKSVPVGITTIRLRFDLQSLASDEQLSKLIELTERYCVVWQTLQTTAQLHSNWLRVESA